MQRTLINEAKVLKRNYMWMIYYKDAQGSILDIVTSASNLEDALKIGIRVLNKRGLRDSNIIKVTQYKLVETYIYEMEEINNG